MNERGNRTAVVMPEDDWFRLCRKQCKARRKKYGEDECDDPDGEPCDECVGDAIDRAPERYWATPAEADSHDPLPGCRRDQ